MLRAVISGVPARDAGARQAWRFRATVPSSLRARVADLLPRQRRDGARRSGRAPRRRLGDDAGVCRSLGLARFIRFNLRGRERSGVVEPDSVSELVEQIREGLESFTLESGEPAVTAVDATSSAAGAGGEPSPLLPDLVVRWSELPTRRGERLVLPNASVRFVVPVPEAAGPGTTTTTRGRCSFPVRDGSGSERAETSATLRRRLLRGLGLPATASRCWMQREIQRRRADARPAARARCAVSLRSMRHQRTPDVRRRRRRERRP